jgi:hypothetical protein
MAQSPMPEKARAAAAAAAAAAGCLGRKMYRVDIVNVMYGRVIEEDELRMLALSSALC